MNIHILAVGDVVGDAGVDFLSRHLPALRKLHDIHFTVVCGENAACNGLLPAQADAIFAAGADVITMGNHTWDKQQIVKYMDENPYIIRPANYTRRAPGRGWGVFDGPRGLRIRVVNLIGRTAMDSNFDNPFTRVDEVLKREEAGLTLVDFHAEATSEKLALAYHRDGQVSALWGTHTHVPTADERIMPKGTGYITDLGMTGPIEGVLGIKPEQSVEQFLGGLSGRYQVPEGPCKMQGAVFSLDSDTGLCVDVERVDIR